MTQLSSVPSSSQPAPVVTPAGVAPAAAEGREFLFIAGAVLAGALAVAGSVMGSVATVVTGAGLSVLVTAALAFLVSLRLDARRVGQTLIVCRHQRASGPRQGRVCGDAVPVELVVWIGGEPLCHNCVREMRAARGGQ